MCQAIGRCDRPVCGNVTRSRSKRQTEPARPPREVIAFKGRELQAARQAPGGANWRESARRYRLRFGPTSTSSGVAGGARLARSRPERAWCSRRGDELKTNTRGTTSDARRGHRLGLRTAEGLGSSGRSRSAAWGTSLPAGLARSDLVRRGTIDAARPTVKSNQTSRRSAH